MRGRLISCMVRPMPHKDPEARRAYDAQRRAAIKADPEKLAAKRTRDAAAQRRRMQDPQKRAVQYARTKTWAARDSNKLASELRNRFGIDAHAYEELLAKQEGVCAVCRRKERIAGRRLAVDHCHKTGAVRGLLCQACNTGLGKFEDNPVLLARAAQYLGGAP